ncbi:MAG: deoxyribodipyrimidine photo-lyase [Caldilineales bacterium]|nr:deoxyribodipyrimidine photo-lyase [Caldilineales bacterium]
MTTAIVWFRRDLRISDNPALTYALAHADEVIPAFILDPALRNSRYVGEKRVDFLWGGLASLDQSLRERGSRLILRQGEPAEALSQLAAETNASFVTAERDYSPFARKRDQHVSERLKLVLQGGASVLQPEEVLKDDGSPYVVYTPYSRTWKQRMGLTPIHLEEAPEAIVTPSVVEGLPLPAIGKQSLFPPGEAEAQRRLNAFIGGDNPAIFYYAEQRNRMDLEGTSQLSPYLRFGMLSPRQAVISAQSAIASAPNAQARKGAETWLNELIWREFYLSILFHFPHVMREAFRPEYDNIVWQNDKDDFAAWREGRTGYPIVDAAMRQLAATGWMHNRARMIVASFLVKDLLIDWRWGERWFMQNLVDGDPAANNGGWQWTAGVGVDAAPYFRVFNPVLQGRKFDPGGDFVRRWAPELANVPNRYIHNPWEMPAAEQRAAGCQIGRDYPLPVVDHKAARDRTLTAYAQARAS